MRDTNSQKPHKDISSEGDLSSDGNKSHSSPDETNGVGDMNAVIENNLSMPSNLNENVDWSLTGILNHPSGVDFALKQNLAMMEQQTKDLIENGSVEELLAALDENTRQLEMLQHRMESSLGWLTKN
jgi:hypothetical protein